MSMIDEYMIDESMIDESMNTKDEKSNLRFLFAVKHPEVAIL